jgi:hypothetical protein
MYVTHSRDSTADNCNGHVIDRLVRLIQIYGVQTGDGDNVPRPAPRLSATA